MLHCCGDSGALLKGRWTFLWEVCFDSPCVVCVGSLLVLRHSLQSGHKFRFCDCNWCQWGCYLLCVGHFINFTLRMQVCDPRCRISSEKGTDQWLDTPLPLPLNLSSASAYFTFCSELVCWHCLTLRGSTVPQHVNNTKPWRMLCALALNCIHPGVSRC